MILVRRALAVLLAVGLIAVFPLAIGARLFAREVADPRFIPRLLAESELYDLLFDTLDFDRAFWLHVGRTAKGPVLDLGCGTGRVLIPLLEAGVDADGVDLSPAMLDRLEAKAAKKGLHPRLLAADMSDFTMPRRYARVISAFNAFAWIPAQ